MVARTLAALAVVLAAGCAGGSDVSLSLAPGEKLAIGTSVTPRTSAFGDPITARLRILLDRRRVDPDSVKVLYRFRPYSDRTTVERVDSGNLTALLYTIELSCLTLFCLPEEGASTASFAARVTAGMGPVQEVRWPEITVLSRLPRQEDFVPENSGGEADQWPPKWRATVWLPEPSYPLSPGALTWVLALLGLLLVAGAATATLSLLGRGRLLRAPRVSPLEQALQLLRNAGSDEERRAALEALALALDPDLAKPARALAWSERQPSESAARELAARAEEAR